MDRTEREVREFTVSGAYAAQAARSEFSSAAYDWLSPGVASEARLLIHEIVAAMALRQGLDATVTVRLARLGPNAVRGEVAASRGGGIRPARALGLISGLRRELINSLTDRWGIVLDSLAPYVWFEIGRRRPTAP
jgi:hypothetical protein